MGLGYSCRRVVEKICGQHPDVVRQKFPKSKWLPVHYACSRKKTRLKLLQLLAMAAPDSFSIKVDGKLPLRILHELPAGKALIEFGKEQYPQAYDEMFKHSVSASGVVLQQQVGQKT